MGLKSLAAALTLALASTASAAEITVYTGRHYESDVQIYKGFEAQTGIKVNYIEGKADELLARLEAEGDASPADVYITADAGNLWRAEAKGVLQPVQSETLKAAIPAEYRDPGDEWFGFARRARIIMIAADASAIDPALVQNYEDLSRPELKGRLCMRSGSAIYNLSLMGAMIDKHGAEKAEAWAKGVVANLAKAPAGGDTDQIKAVAAGECQIGVTNSYYLARMMRSNNPEDRAVVEKVGVVFPNQNSWGTHVNIAGAAVARHAKNQANAVKFLEYLASPSAQNYFANGNNEWPVAKGVNTDNPALKSMTGGSGQFKSETIPISAVGANQVKVQQMLDRVGFK